MELLRSPHRALCTAARPRGRLAGKLGVNWGDSLCRGPRFGGCLACSDLQTLRTGPHFSFPRCQPPQALSLCCLPPRRPPPAPTRPEPPHPRLSPAPTGHQAAAACSVRPVAPSCGVPAGGWGSPQLAPDSLDAAAPGQLPPSADPWWSATTTTAPTRLQTSCGTRAVSWARSGACGRHGTRPARTPRAPVRCLLSALGSAARQPGPLPARFACRQASPAFHTHQAFNWPAPPRPHGAVVSKDDKERLLGQKGAILWFTGGCRRPGTAGWPAARPLAPRPPCLRPLQPAH